MTDRKPAPPDEPADPRRRIGHPGHLDWEVDEASDESFPASDPPAFTGSTAGAGDHSASEQDSDDDERERRDVEEEERPDA